MLFKKFKKAKLKKILKRARFLLFALLFVLVAITIFQMLTFKKVSYGVFLGKHNLGGKNIEQALKTISLQQDYPQKIILRKEDQQQEISTEQIGLEYSLESSVKKVYQLTRTGNFFYDLFLKIKLLFKPKVLGFDLSLNEELLNEKMLEITKVYETKPVPSRVILEKDGSIKVEKGKKGIKSDIILLRAGIGADLSFRENPDIEIPFKETGETVDDLKAQKARERAEKLISKQIKLTFREKAFTVSDREMVSFINPSDEYYQEEIAKKIEVFSSQINKAPQNSVFVFEEGRVKEFVPSSEGFKVNNEVLKTKLVENIRSLETASETENLIEIPVEITAPEIENKDVNSLGIETILGRGTSTFYGSITNRIHNIGLASSRFKGVLVAPGETFSFNQTLGDVSEETGYKQAYIIKEGKTILGDGGGVCQVSTTLFRAVLDAGLPILERQAHAYRVGYYEQDSPPGLDATVYDPHPDLKFKNDTGKHLLIQSVFSSANKSLVFEIYGTNDGRKSLVGKPVITESTPPEEDLYIDDPNLPAGTVNQIEYKAWGAKVRFTYKVERNGETIFNKTFYSNYKPWQAVYLRGTKPL